MNRLNELVHCKMYLVMSPSNIEPVIVEYLGENNFIYYSNVNMAPNNIDTRHIEPGSTLEPFLDPITNRQISGEQWSKVAVKINNLWNAEIRSRLAVINARRYDPGYN